MHFHLPKPLHGWREFFGEVGIIVVGVLIALGAEQVVETWHQSHEAEKSIAAVRYELAQFAGVFDERRLVQTCLERRLRQLDIHLRSARRTGRLQDLGVIGRPPTRPLPVAAWEAALANGTAAHFEDQERNALSTIYSVAPGYSAAVEEEGAMWATLRLLENDAGTIDGPLLAELSTTLARLRYRSWLNSVNAQQEFEAILALGIRPDYILTNEVNNGTREFLVASTRRRAICAPLVVDGRPEGS